MQRDDVAALFSYHAPSPARAALHRQIDGALGVLALDLFDMLPPCAERTLAIRALHDARHHANTALAVHGP